MAGEIDIKTDLAGVVKVSPDQIVSWDAANIIQQRRDGTRFGAAMIVECAVEIDGGIARKTIRFDDEHDPAVQPDTRAAVGLVAMDNEVRVYHSSTDSPVPTSF